MQQPHCSGRSTRPIGPRLAHLLPPLLLLLLSRAAAAELQLPHHSRLYQPQCRAYQDSFSGLQCSVNPLTLASLQWTASSLYGRILLQTAARQVQCNQHMDMASCLADRDNYCSPMLTPTAPDVALDCVVGGGEWTTAAVQLSNGTGAVFSCPGSLLEQYWHCLFALNFLGDWGVGAANYNVTVDTWCRLARCAQWVGDPDLADLYLCVPPFAANDTLAAITSVVNNYNSTIAGNCALSREIQPVFDAFNTGSVLLNALDCPFQYARFDPTTRTCTLDLIAAPAARADDLVIWFIDLVQNEGCAQRLASAEFCEGAGLGERTGGLLDYVADAGLAVLADVQSSVPDVEALSRFINLSADGLRLRAAARRTAAPLAAAAVWALAAGAGALLLLAAGTAGVLC